MAEKFFRETTCDRCEKQIALDVTTAAQSPESGDTDSGPVKSKDGKAGPPVVSFKMDGAKPVEYKDLCDKCKKRCRDLLNMAANDYNKIKAKKKKGAKPGETGKNDKKNGVQPTA